MGRGTGSDAVAIDFGDLVRSGFSAADTALPEPPAPQVWIFYMQPRGIGQAADWMIDYDERVRNLDLPLEKAWPNLVKSVLADDDNIEFWVKGTSEDAVRTEVLERLQDWKLKAPEEFDITEAP